MWLVALVDSTVVVFGRIVEAEAAVHVLRTVRVRLAVRIVRRHRVPSPTLPLLGMAMPAVFRDFQGVADQLSDMLAEHCFGLVRRASDLLLLRL